MITYNYETPFSIEKELEISYWLSVCISEEKKKLGELNYIFSDDEYLTDINVKYLKHNTLTDIITFDYTLGSLISGDIFISVDRVRDNAKDFKAEFVDELHRVMIHGVLHCCGYRDKSKAEKQQMRAKEDYYLSLRTFKKD